MMNEGRFQGEFDEVAALVERHKRFLILGHIDPDGDCIGSMLALARFLRAKGKRAVCFAPGEIPKIYLNLPDAEMIASESEIERFEQEVVFTLDSPTPARTADVVEPKNGQLIVNIDHHPTNEGYGTINIVEEHTSAAAVLVYRLLEAIDPAGIDSVIADYLYLGILMDTGGFRFQNTNEESLSCAASLVGLGAQPHRLAHDFLFVKTYDSLKLLGAALQSLELHCGGRLAVMEVSDAMIAESGGSMTDTEGFVDYPASVDTIELSALFRELEPEEIRVSLRSRSTHDVARLAERFGGGGHRKAAGLTIRKSLEEAKSIIVAEITKLLEQTEARDSGEESDG
jgi:phosphoesterase RecJ-like protein